MKNRWWITALLVLGLTIAASAPASASPIVPNTSCLIVSQTATSHGFAYLNGTGSVYAWWFPAATKMDNNCNGVAIRYWNDHYQHKNTVAWVRVYPNYPSDDGAYNPNGGVSVNDGTFSWISLGPVSDGTVFRVFAYDPYSGGDSFWPTLDRED